MHEMEIRECRVQIKSLMDHDSAVEYRRVHLEKSTEDLKADVCSLSLALEQSRETHKKEILQFMGEFKRLDASAERWADEEKRLSRGWEDARFALERVKSELTCALSMHEQVAAELKDSQETVVRVNSQLKNVQATKAKLWEEAQSKVMQLNKELAVSLKSQERLASKLSSQSHENTLNLEAAQKALADAHLELESIKSELASCKRQNAQMGSQLSKTKSESAANSSLLQKAESDLSLAKADLLVARKHLAKGKHVLPLLDASPNLKLPVDAVPLSFPIQPCWFVKNIVVRMTSGSQVGIFTYIS